MIEDICDNWIKKGDYTDLPAKQKADNDTYNVYWDKPEFSDIRYELESAISQAEVECEKQGFIYGFKKAMEMFFV